SGEQYAGTDHVVVNLQLVPDLVNFTVTILDVVTGTPLSDAVVVVDGNRYVAGIDGKLTFDNVPRGSYPVQVSRHCYSTFNENVTVDKDQVEIYLNKISSINLPYSESFNGSLPSNYSIYDVETLNYDPIWSVENSNSAGGVPDELVANWRNGVSTVRLLLPPINTVGLSTINLTFRYFFDDWGSDMKVLVETSTNGSDWEPTGWEINSGNGNFGPEQITIPISSNTNSSNTYIAFTLTGDLYQLDDWYVDDIQVTQPGVTLYNASFTVYNNSSSEPLSGAEIALNGYGSLLTNNAGIVYFTNIPNGTYSYTVTKSDYSVYNGSITINNGNAIALVGMVPLSYYSLTLNVYKQGTSTPISGALVTLSGENAAETNSQGKVVWTNLPSGTYSYTITKEGYNNYSGSVSVTYNRTLNRYLSQKYFEANFTVIDANSNPVQNALISVAGKTAVVTNESGQATVGNLENANYNFTIQKTGYSLYSSSFNISGTNSSVNSILALAPAPQYSVLFKVTKLDATPISNATVWLTGFGPVTTNVNGEVLFTNIAGGSTLSYEVQQTNFLNSIGSIGPMNENKQLVVVLKPLIVEKYQVIFNVKDASGTSLAGALVDLGGYGTGSTNGAGNVVFADIDFTDQLPYQVSLAGYKTVLGNATVHSNTTIPVILPLLATTTYSVTFSITNSTGGYVYGANVSLEGYGTLLTDNMGSALFNQVNPQNGINYIVSMPPYSSLSGTVNVVNTNIVQNLILSTNVYRALFTVVDQFGNPLEGVNVEVLGGGRAVTNTYGNAIIGGLSTGTYSYNVYMPNGTPMNGGFNITNSDLPIPVTMSRPTQTVTFTVKDEFGGVIQDANVELSGYGSKLTDADGNAYYANVLSANNKSYTVSKSGFYGFNGVINIENSSVEQNVMLNIVRHSVQFSVSAGSKSITDATVTFNGVTNATGNYLFSNVIPGSGYAYSVSREGYVTKDGTANVTGYSEIPINLEVEEFMVTFNVSLPTTKVGQKSNPAKILIGGTTDTLIVSENGSTNVSLPKGYYNFKVWADGCQPHYGSFEIVNTAINISVTLKIPTGVDDNYLLSIKAYPNPFQSQINLDNCSEIKQIIVHNLIGQPVIDEKYSNYNRITMNTADLLPGVYFIKLIGNDGATRAIRMIKN
ncbi:MAG: PEGA domain-containing protein, partial [Bacteroidales bacterium]